MNPLKTLGLPVAALAMLAAPAMAEDKAANGDAELAKLLEGRVAGEPQNCVPNSMRKSSRIIDGTAIVYGSGSTIWVNYTQDPESLDKWDTMVSRQFGSSLCRQDMVNTIDRSTGMYTGNIFLTDFIPYHRES